MKEKSIKEYSELFSKKWKSIERLSEEYAKAAGLTPMSLNVLSIIYDHAEGCTQKYICQQIQYNKQSVNMIIKSFWEQGYVELVEMREDRRNKQVKLSESGKLYAEKVIGLLWKVENDALENTTPEQRKALMAFFEAYEESFRSGVEALSNMMNTQERVGDVL